MKFKNSQHVLIRPNFIDDMYEDTSSWYVGIVYAPIDFMLGEQWYEVHYDGETGARITATRPESQMLTLMTEDDVDTLVSL